MEDKNPQILIIDLGSQYTEIIRRSLRYLGFHSVILSSEDSLKWIKENNLKGIILSGGSASIYDTDAPEIPKEILNIGVPILGICLGMQWLAYIHDENSIQAVEEGKSYGPVEVTLKKSRLFEKLPNTINAWSSHGDSVKNVPSGFSVVATSKGGSVIEAMECPSRKLWALQFHPEVEQTEDENIILNNFISGICVCEKDYNRQDIIEEIRNTTKKY